ncbi:MAG: hypothetical protein ACXVGS_09370 [Oryzihumus sp.]
MNDNGAAFGWGTLALINAGLAQTKGRSGVAWFLVSLLLGPLATLAIVMMSPPPPPRPAGPPATTPGPPPAATPGPQD